MDSPTFIGLRQRDFNGIITCDVSIISGEAGITMYMDENHHYDLAIREKLDNKGTFEVIERLNIGNIKSVENHFDLTSNSNVTLVVYCTNESYTFGFRMNGEERSLGTGITRYLSSEVAGGFTGVMIGLYAYDTNSSSIAEFTKFACEYKDKPLK